jgi:hypothetical protein
MFIKNTEFTDFFKDLLKEPLTLQKLEYVIEHNIGVEFRTNVIACDKDLKMGGVCLKPNTI